MIRYSLLVAGSLFLSVHCGYGHVGKKVGVFCSADDKISETFKSALFILGECLAANDFKLVTGGSKTGLMKTVVDGFLQVGEQETIQGVIPHVLKALDIVHAGIPEHNRIWTETMHTRLAEFHKQCDYVIVAPGGFGTLHEFMDFLVHKQFNVIKTKIILLSLNNFWYHQIEQFRAMVSAKALTQQHLDLFVVVRSVDECLSYLEEYSKSIEQAVSLEQADHGLETRYWEK